MTRDDLARERLRLAAFAARAYPNSAAAVDGWRRALDAVESLIDRAVVEVRCPCCGESDCAVAQGRGGR